MILTQQCSAGDEHPVGDEGICHGTRNQRSIGTCTRPHSRSSDPDAAIFRSALHKNLDSVLGLVDDDIEWLIVPTGDVIRRKRPSSPARHEPLGASPDRTKKLLNLFAAEDYACMEYISGGTSQQKSTSVRSRSRRLAGRTRFNAALSSTSKITRSTASTSTSTWIP